MIENLIQKLNPPQREAVSSVNGPVLVLAGAGTGKTRVITYRIAYMIQNGIAPENILGMTFTNKAAREMRDRVGALLSASKASKVTLGTFHSFCARVLRKEIKALGYLPNFTIADDSDQKGIMRQAEAELGYKKDELPIEHILSYIGRQKNHLIEPHKAIKIADSDFDVKAAHVYERYQQILENQNMLDFDDMLMFVFKLWDRNPELLKKYQEKYTHILVDEYQDTNEAQFSLLRLLAGKNMNICVVGDDDQSIYGWRGAQVEHILEFPEHFPGAKIIKLEQNYRSTNKILHSANCVIKSNSSRYEKKLWSEQGEGENIKIVKTDSDEAEADFIAASIHNVMAGNTQYNFKDFAILYRSNYLSRLIEQSLRRAEIPYRMVGSNSFFSRKEIKDAVAYLRVVLNPKEDQSLLRIIGVPSRGIGDKAISGLKQLQGHKFKPFSELLADADFINILTPHARESSLALHRTFEKFRTAFESNGALADKINRFLTDVGYLPGIQSVYKDLKESEKRLENVMEFINSAAQFESKVNPDDASLCNFLESQALLDDNDKVDEEQQNSDSVTLTTVHAAKGLEFPYVFIMGAEHNLFPHERAVEERSLDEELRLFYVALTRAKLNIVISYAEKRFRHGKSSRQRPSQFIRLLPENISEHLGRNDFLKPLDDEQIENSFADIFSILEKE